jgi:hypothetical protein
MGLQDSGLLQIAVDEYPGMLAYVLGQSIARGRISAASYQGHGCHQNHACHSRHCPKHSFHHSTHLFSLTNKICNAPGKYKFDPGYIDYLLVKSKSNGGDWDVV